MGLKVPLWVLWVLWRRIIEVLLLFWNLKAFSAFANKHVFSSKVWKFYLCYESLPLTFAADVCKVL